MYFNGPQIYVLRNADLPFSKIGYTRRTAEIRAKEYTRGGLWSVEKFWPFKEQYFVPNKREAEFVDAGPINIESIEYFILSLLFDFRIPHVDTVTLSEGKQSWLEVFTLYPSDAVYLIDRMLFDLNLVDTDACSIGRLPWPNDPKGREYLEELWRMCRIRMDEMQSQEFGDPFGTPC